MRKTLLIPVLSIFMASSGLAQLTTDQKLLDFQTMAAIYAKRYAPYEWKKQLFGFDLLNIKPFLDRAAATKNDLDYYALCAEYVNDLHDGHDFFQLPSNYSARLGFSVDLYDGKPLVDSISRSLLPTATFPVQIGDELVSVDGTAAADLITTFMKFTYAGDTRFQARTAAGSMTSRAGSRIPSANLLGPTATVVIRRRSSGNLETYTLNWVATGVPLIQEGPVPSPSSAGRQAQKRRMATDIPDGQPYTQDDDVPGLPVLMKGPGMDEDALRAQLPDYLRQAFDLTRSWAPETNVLNFGGFGPIFSLPAGFRLRLGSRNIDEFVSGTFPVGSLTIGYLRIPSFAPGSIANALSQLETEVAFFKQNTDGLVIDEMRNPGGIVFYTTEIARRLIPGGFRTMGFQLRATREWVNTFSAYYENAKALGAPAVVIAFYKSFLDDVNTAYSGNRGDTGPLPLDQIFLSPQPFAPSLDVSALKDNGGNLFGYDKPMLVLIDEFSVSGGDAFAAVMQDNKAATLFGHRTGGLGGTNVNYTAGSYSEAVVGVTRGLMVRKAPVVTPDFPTTQYVENVGVRPEIESDYMTLDNLLQNGAPFVNAFSQAIANLIAASKK